MLLRTTRSLHLLRPKHHASLRNRAVAVGVTNITNGSNSSSFLNHTRKRSSMSSGNSNDGNGNGRYAFLADLGLSAREPGVCDGHSWFASGPVRQQINPATGEMIGEVQLGTAEDYERVVAAMGKAKAAWAAVPAPARGEVVRRIGNRLREKQDALGRLVSAEMGKILPEGIGEVQVSVCDIPTAAVSPSEACLCAHSYVQDTIIDSTTQESVDICDFAVGLSRALNGAIIPSERCVGGCPRSIDRSIVYG